MWVSEGTVFQAEGTECKGSETIVSLILLSQP